MSHQKFCDCSIVNQSCIHSVNQANHSDKLDNQQSRAYNDEDDDQIKEIERLNEEIRELSSLDNKRKPNGRMRTDSELMTDKRVHLRKFEPLRVDGRTISGMSIGGFSIDLEETARKAREIIPIPASKLPVIFVDEELNFYHHFFQGLTIILKQYDIDEVCQPQYTDGDTSYQIAEELNEIMESGYDLDDSELVILVKKVLTSTFESLQQRRQKQVKIRWEVVANLWGFQYIEPGMTCKPDDIRMWLNMSYSHYKLLWFNNFKSTTIPGFARLANQRTNPARNKSFPLRIVEESASTDYDVVENIPERRRHKQPESVKTSRRSSYQGRNQQSMNIQRWIAGK
jgi:hypothetical protein